MSAFNNIFQLYSEFGFDVDILRKWSIDENDWNILRSDIQERQPRIILEIGTFVGVSSLLMSSVVGEYQTIYSIDPNLSIEDEIFAVGDTMMGSSRKGRSLDIARMVRDKCQFGKNIHFLEGCLDYDMSYSGAHGFKKHLSYFLAESVVFDLIFIDGLHFADAVLSDLSSSEKILSRDGVLFLHDGKGRWAEEVLFGICKFLEKNNNYEVNRFPDSSLVRLQRCYE